MSYIFLNLTDGILYRIILQQLKYRIKREPGRRRNLFQNLSWKPSADDFVDEMETILSLEDVNFDWVVTLDDVADDDTWLFDVVEGGDETASVEQSMKDDGFEVDEAFNESPTKIQHEINS